MITRVLRRAMHSHHPHPRAAALRVLGLMAGTSLDGIDAVWTRTDGETLQRLGDAITVPYSAATRTLIEQAVSAGDALRHEPGLRAELDRRIADEHAQAVRALVSPRKDLDLVGFHGQTVWHAPQQGVTVQLGDPQRLANLLDVPVIGKLRDADMQAGGEGAPLAPVYHAALLGAAGFNGPSAWLNLGGVANLSLVDEGLIAGFDCGPGNALLDRMSVEHTGAAFDAGGARALAGVVHTALRDRFLADDFFDRAPPKSLDRDAFLTKAAFCAIRSLSLNNAMATLAAITVGGVRRGLEFSRRKIQTLVVSGGGVHNRAIMKGLAEIPDCRVLCSDEIGSPSDGVEAELVAFLAARRVRGLACSFPTTTGARCETSAGERYEPEWSS